MEEKRIHQVQSSLIQSAEIERNVMPIVNACLDGVVKAANRIQSTHVCCHADSSNRHHLSFTGSSLYQFVSISFQIHFAKNKK